MRRYIISIIMLILPSLYMVAESPLYTIERDSTLSPNERRIYKRERMWAALIPKHEILQYAGNMGLISTGVGWNYGKHNQWETELMLGFVPKYSTERAHVTITIKENYIPWRLSLGQSPFSIEPLHASLYVTSIFGHEFWNNQPERYPKGYYWFSTKARINIAIGHGIMHTLSKTNKFALRSYTIFWETSTTELDIIYKAKNKNVPIKDIIHFSIGAKFQIM